MLLPLLMVPFLLPPDSSTAGLRQRARVERTKVRRRCGISDLSYNFRLSATTTVGVDLQYDLSTLNADGNFEMDLLNAGAMEARTQAKLLQPLTTPYSTQSCPALCCIYLTFVLWSSATLAPLGLPLPRPSGLLLNFSGAEPTAEPDVVPCILRRLLSCNRLGARSGRAVAAAAAAGVWTRGAVPMPMPRSMPRSPSFAAKYLYSARSHLQFSC